MGALLGTAAILASASSAARTDPYVRYLASANTCPGSQLAGLTPRAAVQALTCLVDYARARRGVPPLRSSAELNRGAALKLADDLRCGRLVSHDPCGSGWRSVYRQAGYLPAHRVWLGENLGYAGGSLATPATVVDMWLNSPMHRRNLFDPRFRDGGFAAKNVARGVLYAGAFGTRRVESLG